MKYLIIASTLLIQSCAGQTSPKQQIHNSDFNWTITIPENFDTVSTEQWAKMENRGAEAIEKTIEEKVVNRPTTIFVFRSDQFNYFESNYQPYDTATDGDYLETCQSVNQTLYQTFITQIEGVSIDTASSTEKIDSLDFRVFKMKVTYPNNDMVLNTLMFSRLFGKREFSVNLMYVDKIKGALMLKAWKESKFGKK